MKCFTVIVPNGEGGVGAHVVHKGGYALDSGTLQGFGFNQKGDDIEIAFSPGFWMYAIQIDPEKCRECTPEEQPKIHVLRDDSE